MSNVILNPTPKAHGLDVPSPQSYLSNLYKYKDKLDKMGKWYFQTVQKPYYKIGKKLYCPVYCLVSTWCQVTVHYGGIIMLYKKSSISAPQDILDHNMACHGLVDLGHCW